MEHLYITDFGVEHCDSDKEAIKHPFRHHVIHFVFAGNGYINGKMVSAGECFLCRGGEKSIYAPDPSDPWYYGWIGGNGMMFEQLLSDMGFSEKSNVCTIRKSSLVEMLIRLGTSSKEQEYRCGLFYAIAGLQIHTRENSVMHIPEQHIRDAVQHIESVSGNTTPEEIARVLHLSRAYLRNLFHTAYGISLQKYIIRYRMRRASELLAETDLPIGAISAQVGYQDPLMFSKMFKRYRKMSPTRYRSLTISFTQAVIDAQIHDPRYRGEDIEYLYENFEDEK